MLLPGSERIFSRSRIRTPLGKWDSPKSPQGYCRAVADPDFQIRGGGGGAVSNAIFLRASVWTKYNGGPSVDPPLIGKENGFQEKDDRSSGYGLVAKKGRECGFLTPSSPYPPPPRLLADPELPPLFHFLNFGKQKQYLIHPHQRQQKQQIVFRFNI